MLTRTLQYEFGYIIPETAHTAASLELLLSEPGIASRALAIRMRVEPGLARSSFFLHERRKADLYSNA